MSETASNVVLADISLTAFCFALLVSVIGVYFGWRNWCKRWYYNKSIKRCQMVKKSYTVTWRITVSICGSICALAIVAVIYIIAGLLFDGFLIFSGSVNKYRFYVVLPFALFWITVAAIFVLIFFCDWITRPEHDDKAAEKFNEFDVTLNAVDDVQDQGYGPGQRCPVTGKYLAINKKTKIVRCELNLSAGQDFPKFTDESIYFIKVA